MLVMRKMQEILARQGRDVAFVVVSYDPARDSPAEWRRYREARRLPASWHFLSGAEADTRRLADFLEMKYWIYDEHVMHDFRIVVFDADGNRKRDILWEQFPDLERELAGLLPLPRDAATLGRLSVSRATRPPRPIKGARGLGTFPRSNPAAGPVAPPRGSCPSPCA